MLGSSWFKGFLLIVVFASSHGLANRDFPRGASTAVIQSDGKIVVVGSTSSPITGQQIALARVNADGTLDEKFGAKGKVAMDLTPGCDTLHSVALDADGKIVVGGSRNYTNGCAGGPTFFEGFVARFEKNGDLDKKFGKDGFAEFTWANMSSEVISVAVQPDKKILAAGTYGASQISAHGNHYVARLNADGSRDKKFADDGILPSEICKNDPNPRCKSFVKTMILAKNGDVYLGGAKLGGRITYFAEKISKDGKLTDIGANARLLIDIGGVGRGAESLVIDSKGNFILIGSGQNSVVIVKADSQGKRDEAFGGKGIATVSFGNTAHQATRLLVDKDDNVYAQMSVFNMPWGIGMARFTSKGELDVAFGEGKDGKVYSLAGGGRALAGDMVKTKNGIVAVGESYLPGPMIQGAFGIANLSDEGRVEKTFNEGNDIAFPVP